MEQLIPVINKLQDVFSTVGERDILELPQIVVVGSQSSGKSSVLENVVGKDFLPRGTGIVTRVPLIMQLIHVAPLRDRKRDTKTPSAEEWATFLHCPEKVFTDFEEVRQEITNETQRITGGQKAVSDLPINLRIYSPSVLDLTLVDLPGITKVPVGDQPKDIEQQIRRLILKYINNPNSIILAVSPANSDLANSDALKIAKEVDPEGNRTIGVCTKIDLMDKGTDATDILTGKQVPVKLGIVGVINRSQYDIDHKLPISDALASEREYFQRHYPALAHKCGCEYLSKVLNKLLLHHIRDCLPSLKDRIKQLQSKTQQVLASLGSPLGDRVDKSAVLLNAITRFVELFRASINGTPTSTVYGSQVTELSGGARIYHIFHETFGRTLASVDALDGLTEGDILTAIRNATGPKPSLFVPEVSFEILVKRQIKRLEEPALRCVELVFEELESIMFSCLTSSLSRFNALKERVVHVSSELLRRRLPVTNDMVENLVSIELAYINTNHPDFEGGAGAVLKTLMRLAREENVEMPSDFTHVPSVSHTERDGRRTHSPPPPPAMVGSVTARDAAMDRGRGAGSVPPAPAFVPPAESPDKMGVLEYLFGRRSNARSKGTAGSPAILSAPTREDFVRALSSEGDDDHHGQASGSGAFGPHEGARKLEVELIQSLIRSYFVITKKNIQDTVPKSVMHFLVNYVQENLQNELVSNLYKEEKFDELLAEDPLIAKQREDAWAMSKALNRAITIVAEVTDTRDI